MRVAIQPHCSPVMIVVRANDIRSFHRFRALYSPHLDRSNPLLYANIVRSPKSLSIGLSISQRMSYAMVPGNSTRKSKRVIHIEMIGR